MHPPDTKSFHTNTLCIWHLDSGSRGAGIGERMCSGGKLPLGILPLLDINEFRLYDDTETFVGISEKGVAGVGGEVAEENAKHLKSGYGTGEVDSG